MALLCLNIKVKAQDNKAVDVTLKGIQIGQKVPDVTITGLHNYKDANGKPATTAKLSDFKGKLLILDFWATWCSPCIAMIPKMDSLQKIFGDKIQFLSITYQANKEVLPFLEKFEKQRGKHYDLPIVTGDKSLHQLFPHVYLPHYVWIDGEGMVSAITGYAEVNKVNIEKLIDGKILGVTSKNDIYRDFNPENDLNTYLSSSKDEKQLSQGIITSHLKGVPSQTYSKKIGDNYTLTAANVSLRFLFRMAFSGDQFINDKMIDLVLNDSNKVTSSLKGEQLMKWRDEHTFCYQLKLPAEQRENALKIMRKDLALLFPEYNASLELKMRNSWVLKVIGDTSKLKRTLVKPYLAIDASKIEMRNANLSSLINRLARYDLQLEWPLYIDKELDLEVNLMAIGNTRSIKSLNKMLHPYGIGFIKEIRYQDVLVISDRNLEKGQNDEM